jgi:hypothetical protein
MRDHGVLDLLAGCKHIKTTPKCEVTHDIEGVEVEPKGSVNFLARAGLELSDQ